MIKTFRGLLADGAQRTIRLSTNNGLRGYRIKKFEVMTGDDVGSIENASLLALWKYEQDTVSGSVSFDNPNLLAAADYRQHDNEGYGITATNIIFENEIFNQDIFITHKDLNTDASMNYYIELELISLDLGEATVATLKDMRGSS